MQVGSYRLSGDVLPHFSLVLCEVLVAFVEIDVAKRIEYCPCIRQEVLIDLCLCLAKSVVLVIEPFEQSGWVDLREQLFEERGANKCVDKMKDDQRDAILKIHF